ncbi:BTAD domain-containing putative transcriptional regulator [Dactylosporangium sp. NPDC049140]|uniref:ATP-binding protein n=1 Tax=Dactylosporangium sp. NPDC049140 TaxID=3155647 RepID=UPI003408607E
MTSELTLLRGVAYRGREITGGRLHDLLALLARDLRTGCGTGWLVEGIWPDKQPENPAKALQVLVFRARAQLGGDAIASTPNGYRLALGDDQVDAAAVLVRAAASTRLARAGDHAAALEHAEAGLAAFGPPEPGDGGAGALGDLRRERAGTYRTLIRARALARSRLDRPAEALEALHALAAERPLDEEVLLELLRCEAATAGPSAALERYERYRRALRDELGTDPGPAVQDLQRRLLQGEAPAVRHGVAQEPNALLGRDDDIAAVLSLLRTSRVTTVAGPGGLGKTRLAQAVARRAEQPAVHFVPLAGVGADVAGAVATALGIPAEAGPPAVAQALGDGPALLVLDNCEHVLAEAADLVRALVALTRELRVLVTSRAPLGLTSEWVYPLPELDLATAVELFGQRARAARPRVELPAAEVERLCAHLDGLPLAVELAAARTRVMSVAEIARGLRDRFALLRGGARDAPERHHTLHAVVDWSWNLLDAEAQAAMRALSLGPGGFTTALAEHLVEGPDALGVVERLVNHSLLQVVDTPAGTRFRMLETVRAFAAQRREAAGETAGAEGRLLAWARGFGLAHHGALLGADPAPTVRLVRAEQDNLVHALGLAVTRADAPAAAATAAVLSSLWVIESNQTRLPILLEASVLLSHYRPEPELVEVARTAATLLTAIIYIMQGPRATRSLVTLQRLPPAPPDTVVRATAAVLLRTREIFAPGHAALRELGERPEPLLAGIARAFASFVAENEDDMEGALAAARRLLEVTGPAGFGGTPWTMVLAHSRVGELCLALERPDEARRHFRAALGLLEALDLHIAMLQIEWAAALASLQTGALDEAEQWRDRAALGSPEDAVGTYLLDLGVRAEISLARGDTDAGLHLWRRAVERIRNSETPAYRLEPPGFAPEAIEAQAAAVVAHARHGRPELVAGVVAELHEKLVTLLTRPPVNRPVYLVEFPVCGVMLLALAMADIGAAPSAAARMVALAERMRYLRGFQPTLASSRARAAAGDADGPAYAEAVSEYAGLDPAGLRAAALGLVNGRQRLRE